MQFHLTFHFSTAGGAGTVNGVPIIIVGELSRKFKVTNCCPAAGKERRISTTTHSQSLKLSSLPSFVLSRVEDDAAAASVAHFRIVTEPSSTRWARLPLSRKSRGGSRESDSGTRFSKEHFSKRVKNKSSRADTSNREHHMYLNSPLLTT